MFRGVNTLNIDAKGRIAMPKRYHDRLKADCDGLLVVTADPARCLLIYPYPAWEKVEQRLNELPNIEGRHRFLQRLVVGHAMESPMDGQGRILLPPPLREFASLDKHATLLGQGSKFELWDKQTWHDRCEEWLNKDQEALPLSAELGSLTL